MMLSITKLILIISVSRIYGNQTTGLNEWMTKSTREEMTSNGDHYRASQLATDNEETPTCSRPFIEEGPLWCPYNYVLLNTGTWTQLCRPAACAQVDYVKHFTINNLPSDTCIESIDSESNTARICVNNRARKSSDRFQKCSKESLQDSQYEIWNNGTLWDKSDNTMVPLSDYFLTGKGSAMVCDNSDTGAEYSSDPNSTLPWCIPIPNAFNENERQMIDNLITAGHTVLASNKARATVCINTSVKMSRCRNVKVYFADEYEIDENQNFINYKTIEDYSFGDYFLDINHTTVYVCAIPSSPPNRIMEYLYGSACVISAVFLLVALLVHLFYPKLNYHTKALICLAFSFFGAYIIIAVRYIHEPFTDGIINVTLFCFQYIFTLSAFLWLNVLAFDLWKVFSRLKGVVGSGGGSSRKKYIFLAKCVYSWGIPVLMCIVVVAISYSWKAQQALNIRISLERYAWFSRKKEKLIFFNGPMLIILIENLIFFILTIINIRKATSGTEILNKKGGEKLLKIFAKLFLVMGLCWFAEFIAIVVDSGPEEVWYIFNFFNLLQGVFIFIVYVCKKSTLKIVKKRLGLIRDSGDSQITLSTSDDMKRSSVPMSNMQGGVAKRTTS